MTKRPIIQMVRVRPPRGVWSEVTEWHARWYRHSGVRYWTLNSPLESSSQGLCGPDNSHSVPRASLTCCLAHLGSPGDFGTTGMHRWFRPVLKKVLGPHILGSVPPNSVINLPLSSLSRSTITPFSLILHNHQYLLTFPRQPKPKYFRHTTTRNYAHAQISPRDSFFHGARAGAGTLTCRA